MKKFDKFIFIVRHAERADLKPNIDLESLKCGKYDTELTNEGKEEAKKVGKIIRKFIAKNNNVDLNYFNKNNFSLVCSPFTRTIQTAHELIKGLMKKDYSDEDVELSQYCSDNNEVILPIRIEKGLCEHLSTKWYPCHPQEFITCMKSENCEEKEFFKSQINIHQLIHHCSLHEFPTYPESHEECTERFEIVYKRLIENYMENLKFNNLIMVTHFFPVEIFFNLYHKEKIELDVEYSLTLAFRYDEIKKQPVFLQKLYPL
jgi:broad specificity phosphatase PhoE